MSLLGESYSERSGTFSGEDPVLLRGGVSWSDLHMPDAAPLGGGAGGNTPAMAPVLLHAGVSLVLVVE